MPELSATLLIVQRCLPHEDTLTAVDVDEAVTTAQQLVGTDQRQVSVTAHTGDGDTFAIRHFTWENAAAHDSGWHCWVDGLFVGAGDVVNRERAAHG